MFNLDIKETVKVWSTKAFDHEYRYITNSKQLIHIISSPGALIKVSEKSQYNTKGFANENVFTSLQVSDRFVSILAGAANMAIAENTKSQYKTAIRHISRIESDLQLDMSLPFDLKKTLNCVGYL